MRVLAAIGVAALVALGAGAFWLYTPDASRASLEAAYGVAPGDYLTVAGIRLHVRDTGPRTAPTVILLHGFGASLLTFDAWADALAPRFRVVRYDLPGFGLTGADPTGDYSEARATAVLGGLMDALGVARASLVGNSMGGRLAWEFAAAHPERVDKLVLISPDGFASPGFEYGKVPAVPLVARLLPYVLPVALVRASLAPAYADPGKLTNALVGRYRDMMLAPGVRPAILARTAQTILADPEPTLRTIKAPTLLLWGERDGMIPESNAADYLRAIAGSTLTVLPGLGHVPHEEAPDVSLKPVEAFIAG